MDQTVHDVIMPKLFDYGVLGALLVVTLIWFGKRLDKVGAVATLWLPQIGQQIMSRWDRTEDRRENDQTRMALALTGLKDAVTEGETVTRLRLNDSMTALAGAIQRDIADISSDLHSLRTLIDEWNDCPTCGHGHEKSPDGTKPAELAQRRV